MLLRSYLLQPAALRESHVLRPRLMRLIGQGLERSRTVLLDAPAGYGKSLAIAEFLQDAGVSWAYLPGEHLQTATPLVVLTNLAQSIRLRVPEFRDAGQPFLGGETEEPVSLDAQTNVVFEHILNEIQELQRPFLIIIEDYHYLGSEEVRSWIVRLINEAPAGLQFIVSSRFKPKWSLKWFGDGRVAHITRDPFIFQETECLQLAQLMQVPLSEDDIHATFAYAGGWPILYSLVFQRLQRGGGTEIIEQLRQLNRPEQEIFEFIASEFMHSLPASEQDLLCKTAVLTHIDDELCTAVFGLSGTEPLLARFETYGFLRCVDVTNRPRYVHSHNILREFLTQQLRLRSDQEEQALYLKAGALYEQRQDLEDALTVYVQSANFDHASRLIMKHGFGLVLTGDLGKLRDWLSLLPPEIIENTPDLLIYQGIIRTEYARDLAELSLRKALSYFEGSDDLAYIIWINIELVWLYFLRGHNQKASELLPILTQHQTVLDPLRQGRLLFTIGMAHFGIDSFEKAEVYLRQSIELYRELGNLEGHKAIPRITRFLGNTFAIRGYFPAALRTFQEGFGLAKTLKLSAEVQARLKIQEGIIYHNIGDFDQALIALDETEELLSALPNYHQHDQYEWLLIRRGHICRDKGDYAGAQEYYEQVKNSRKGIAMALDLVQEEHCHKALPHALERYRRSRQYQSPVDLAKEEANLGVVYLSIAEQQRANSREYLDTGRKYIEGALPVFEQFNTMHTLTTYRFYLASLYLYLDRTFDAGQNLKYALETMRKNGCYNLDIWQPWTVARLCAHAIKEHIEEDFAVELAIQRLDIANSDDFVPLLFHQDQSVRSRAVQVLHTIGRNLLIESTTLIEQSRSDDQIKRRLIAALISKFITDTGLMRLHRQYKLTLREIDMLLFWITPAFRGSPQLIADKAFLAKAVVNEHLKNIRTKLDLGQRLESEDDDTRKPTRETGLSLTAYHLLIKDKIIDPDAVNPLEQDQGYAPTNLE